MRIYFAGVDRPSFLSELWRCGAKRILISYADYRLSFATLTKHLESYRFDILLDSGAYSAFTRGIKLDVVEYAKFLHQWGSYFEGYFNLDVIGNFDATWDNQDYLEAQGLNPIPVFHYGEPVEILRFMSQKYERIGIGGMVPVSNSDLDRWLPTVFFDKSGNEKYPKVKFHALGLTTRHLLEKYPWDSADSTKWLIDRKFGHTLYEHQGRGKDDSIIDKTLHNIEWHLRLEQEVDKPEYIGELRLF